MIRPSAATGFDRVRLLKRHAGSPVPGDTAVSPQWLFIGDSPDAPGGAIVSTDPADSIRCKSSFSLQLTGLKGTLRPDDLAVLIGGVPIANFIRAGSLSLSLEGISVQLSGYEIEPSEHEIQVVHHTNGYLTNVVSRVFTHDVLTVLPSSARPGDTVEIDSFGVGYTVEIANSTYSWSSPTFALQPSTKTGRMMVGPLPEFGLPGTTIRVLSPAGAVVSTGWVGRSPDTLFKSVSMSWSPEQQHPGKRLRITFPAQDVSGDLIWCRVNGRTTIVHDHGEGWLEVTTFPSIDPTGKVVINYVDSSRGRWYELESDRMFTALDKLGPRFPFNRVVLELSVPCDVLDNNGEGFSTQSVSPSLLYTCEFKWCDTALTATRVEFDNRGRTEDFQSYSSWNQNGYIELDESGQVLTAIRAFDASSGGLTGGNNAHDAGTTQLVKLSGLNLGIQIAGDSAVAIDSGSHLFSKLDSCIYTRYFTPHSGGGTFRQLEALDPSRASQTKLTVRFLPR